jgi:hypothetical protein
VNLLRDVLEELFSMFAADAWLASGIIAIVGAAALVSRFNQPLLSGALLLAGCLCALAGAVLFAAVRKK